jgi:glycosyltransferase involved in cell wall biosynthesis
MAGFMPMNILHVSHAYPPSIGGSQTLMRNLSEQLAARHGDRVTVLTTVADDIAYFHRGGAALPAGVTLVNGVTVERFRVYTGLRRVRQMLAAAAYRLRLPYNDYWRTLEQGPIMPGLAQRIAASRADVVMATAFPLRHMYDTLAGAQRGRLPLVYLGALHLTDRWGFDRPMIYRAIRQADGYIAQTTYERDCLIQRGVEPGKIWVTGVGVHAERFAQVDGAAIRRRLGLGDDPVVTVMAKQVERKRYDLLFQAMARVWQQIPAARLLIAGGRTGYSDRIEAMIAALPAEQRDRVTVVTDFDEGEKAELLAAGDLLVLPSADESFGIVFLEAWACGKPVIGAGVGAVASLIDDGVDGLLYDYPQPESLAHALLTLLRSQDLRTQLGEAGRQKVLATYTWERVAEQVRATYIAVIQNHQRREGSDIGSS